MWQTYLQTNPTWSPAAPVQEGTWRRQRREWAKTLPAIMQKADATHLVLILLCDFTLVEEFTPWKWANATICPAPEVEHLPSHHHRGGGSGGDGFALGWKGCAHCWCAESHSSFTEDLETFPRSPRRCPEPASSGMSFYLSSKKTGFLFPILRTSVIAKTKFWGGGNNGDNTSITIIHFIIIIYTHVGSSRTSWKCIYVKSIQDVKKFLYQNRLVEFHHHELSNVFPYILNIKNQV